MKDEHLIMVVIRRDALMALHEENFELSQMLARLTEELTACQRRLAMYTKENESLRKETHESA